MSSLAKRQEFKAMTQAVVVAERTKPIVPPRPTMVLTLGEELNDACLEGEGSVSELSHCGDETIEFNTCKVGTEIGKQKKGKKGFKFGKKFMNKEKKKVKGFASQEDTKASTLEENSNTLDNTSKVSAGDKD